MHRKSRFFSIIITVLIVIGIFAGIVAIADSNEINNFSASKSFSEKTFSDVNSGDWFYENVKMAYQYNLMVGNSDTTFNPNGNVKLSETITIAARMHSIYNNGSDSFQQQEPWYQPYVDYAKVNGILTFDIANYERAATRAEFAMILSKALPEIEFEKINDYHDGSIPDVRISDDYGSAVFMFYNAGILVGNDEFGTYAPQSNIKRCEVAAIVSRMVNRDIRVKRSTAIIPPSTETPPYSTIPGENPTPSSEQNPGSNSDPKPQIDPRPTPQSSEEDQPQPSSPEPSDSDNKEYMGTNPAFVIENTTANRGEKDVPVRVLIRNNPGIASLAMLVSYDNSLTLRSVEYNFDNAGQSIQPEKMTNPIKLLWISPFEDIGGDWTLATLYFDIAEDAMSGDKLISIVYDPDDVYNINEDSIAFETISGSIKVE